MCRSCLVTSRVRAANRSKVEIDIPFEDGSIILAVIETSRHG